MFLRTTSERMNKDKRLETFQLCFNDYVLEKYNELDDDKKFINTHDEKEKFAEFCEEVLNLDLYIDFYQYCIDEGEGESAICADDIIILLNYSNQYLEENFGSEQTLKGELTKAKIINTFAYVYYLNDNEAILEYLQYNIE